METRSLCNPIVEFETRLVLGGITAEDAGVTNILRILEPGPDYRMLIELRLRWMAREAGVREPEWE